MESFLFIVVCIVWFISGAASFVYWWTKEMNFTWEEFPVAVFAGVVGPVSFLLGWCVHGDSLFKNKDGVLFKKREKSY